jgi:hypothetical protein
LTGDAFNPLTADTGCWFTWCVNAAGTVSVSQGPVVAGDPDTDVPKVYPQLAPAPAGSIPFAIQRVQAIGTASSWVFGTGDWNATGIQDLILNVATLPARAPTTVTA